MPSLDEARRAARSLRAETSLSLRRPLRAIAAFAVLGATVRILYLLSSKSSFEEARAAQEELARALEKTPVAPPPPVNYERVWARVAAIEARIARDEAEVAAVAAVAAAAAAPAPAARASSAAAVSPALA